MEENKEEREVLISVRNVDIAFGKGASYNKAVTNANFDIYKGEIFSLSVNLAQEKLLLVEQS